jgi:hypothetical protein
MMTKQTLTKLAAFSLCMLVMGGCDSGGDPDLDTPRGALLYDLSEAQLEEIHAAYLPEEDIELTRARLTAPFDCSLYGQFCEQVGRDAAYEITGEMVDLALEGVANEEIQAHLDTRIDEAVALADEAEARGEDTFRTSGDWVTQVDGNYRLRVRHGITTPLFGERRAWTEAKTQKKSLGIWSNKAATQLCVDTGANTQELYTFDPITGPNFELLESINPTQACSSLVKTKTVSTYHERNTVAPNAPEYTHYVIKVNGCASAQINGINFGLCAPEYHDIFV